MAQNTKVPQDCFCQLCNKLFKSHNVLASHLESKKHKEMESIALNQGIDKSQMVIPSMNKASDESRMEKLTNNGKSDRYKSEEQSDDSELHGLLLTFLGISIL